MCELLLVPDITQSPRRALLSPHSTDKATEAQGDQVTGPKSQTISDQVLSTVLKIHLFCLKGKSNSLLSVQQGGTQNSFQTVGPSLRCWRDPSTCQGGGMAHSLSGSPLGCGLPPPDHTPSSCPGQPFCPQEEKTPAAARRFGGGVRPGWLLDRPSSSPLGPSSRPATVSRKHNHHA